LIVNVNEVFAPAVGLDGETDTEKRHLLVEEQVDVCPAAATPASIVTPSMLAATIKKVTRATMKPAFGMASPSPVLTEGCERAAGSRAAGDPALHSHLYAWDV
jgi:hypothetical protein